jgi:hypothetical protein
MVQEDKRGKSIAYLQPITHPICRLAMPGLGWFVHKIYYTLQFRVRCIMYEYCTLEFMAIGMGNSPQRMIHNKQIAKAEE